MVGALECMMMSIEKHESEPFHMKTFTCIIRARALNAFTSESIHDTLNFGGMLDVHSELSIAPLEEWHRPRDCGIAGCRNSASLRLRLGVTRANAL
jgi:hypothetical protein